MTRHIAVFFAGLLFAASAVAEDDLPHTSIKIGG